MKTLSQPAAELLAGLRAGHGFSSRVVARYCDEIGELIKAGHLVRHLDLYMLTEDVPGVRESQQAKEHKRRCDAVSVEAVELLKMVVDLDSSGVDYTEEQVEQAKRKAREIIVKVEETT